MNIILCGLPMSGKSSVGKALAEILEMNLVETDRMIEQTFNVSHGSVLTCRQICRQRGEVYFRQLENKQISALESMENSVIALGGGSLAHPANVKVVTGLGHIVYLKADPADLWKRTGNCGIPMYLETEDPQAAFLKRAAERMPVFESLAAYTVDTRGQGVESIVNIVIGSINHGK